MMDPMVKLLIVGLGGFLGAVARWGVAGAVQRLAGGIFPSGTLAVNVLGCAAIGVLMGLVTEHSLFGPGARLFLLAGFLGAFTTFSTFGWETLALIRDGEWLPAFLNVALNVLAGLAAVFAGLAAVRVLGR
jgi:CrcB protein